MQVSVRGENPFPDSKNTPERVSGGVAAQRGLGARLAILVSVPSISSATDSLSWARADAGAQKGPGQPAGLAQPFPGALVIADGPDQQVRRAVRLAADRPEDLVGRRLLSLELAVKALGVAAALTLQQGGGGADHGGDGGARQARGNGRIGVRS